MFQGGFVGCSQILLYKGAGTVRMFIGSRGLKTIAVECGYVSG